MQIMDMNEMEGIRYERRSSLEKHKIRELADNKKNTIIKEFKIGDAPEAGDIEELVVYGTNVLDKELDFAWSIPEDQRVMVRQEDLIEELQVKS